MNNTEIISWVINALLGLALWLGKRTVDNMDERINSVVKELQDFRRDHSHELQTVRQTYLHKDDFREFKDELREVFSEIRQDLKDLKNRV